MAAQMTANNLFCSGLTTQALGPLTQVPLPFLRYLGDGIDDLLVVVVAVDHPFLLQSAKVSHNLSLHPFQRQTETQSKPYINIIDTYEARL